jgi:CPA2 family monovalent cation:H+ antiporter-2/glutathione-regulated potassium-efflux system protein KefB
VAGQASGNLLTDALVLLAAAVLAVLVFKRLGLGVVLGYLAAGVALGPWGVGLFAAPDQILRIAELGVVLLLFIIGLELNPSVLWTMRRDVFGLGTAQVLLCGGLLFAAALATGMSWRAALVAGFALALSSTAFALQLLQERGQLKSPYGQKAFAVLLLQDLSIVPLLALVPLLAPFHETAGAGALALQAAVSASAVAAVILAGRFFLNPLFRLLAKADAREVMVAAALLVVFGAAYLMHMAGLSMALGAFLAGVMLAESSFRHQLEADIEPFRMLLLGLFFIGVGMSIDLGLIAGAWAYVALGVVFVLALKGVAIWALARLFGCSNANALRVAVTIPQGGEFGFVLLTAAVAAGIMSLGQANLLAAIVILTMAATPLLGAVFERTAALLAARGVPSDVVETFSEAKPVVVVLGFGRFGQVVGRMLMAEGLDIVAIDHDLERIEVARKFGYTVYYGDATRVDVLRAAGAGTAVLVALCIDNKPAMTKAIRAIRSTFPETAIFCRAADQEHAAELAADGVDYAIREIFESGIAFGKAALEHVGLTPERIAAIEAELRNRERPGREAESEGIGGDGIGGDEKTAVDV